MNLNSEQPLLFFFWGEFYLNGAVFWQGLLQDELYFDFHFASVDVVGVGVAGRGSYVQTGGCASDLIPAGRGNLNGLGASVPPGAPYFGDEVGGGLADGLSEVDVHVDIETIGFGVDDEVVDVREGEAFVVVTAMTIVAAVPAL